MLETPAAVHLAPEVFAKAKQNSQYGTAWPPLGLFTKKEANLAVCKHLDLAV